MTGTLLRVERRDYGLGRVRSASVDVERSSPEVVKTGGGRRDAAGSLHRRIIPLKARQFQELPRGSAKQAAWVVPTGFEHQHLRNFRNWATELPDELAWHRGTTRASSSYSGATPGSPPFAARPTGH